MIHGVTITPLRIIADHRGAVMHMLRADDPLFDCFGEIYFSMVLPGAIKGWHRHRLMTLNYAVPVGRILLALYDDRADSPTRGEVQAIPMGEGHYVRVSVPPFVWNGFTGLAPGPSYVANCATHPHDPEEIERIDPRDPSIPFDWDAAAKEPPCTS